MKLLIKIYLRDINPYDTMQILNALDSVIEDKDNTKIFVMSNESTFDFEKFEYLYSYETNIQKMINSNLENLDWDIVIPIFRPFIAIRNFDTIIKKIYNEKYPELDGVIWITDNIQKEVATFAVIGRRYYEKFGYIYNPIYNNKNFEEEFTEILKINNDYLFQDTKIFKIISIKSDDDKLFEFRKKLNFTLI